ncbi:Fructoselysine-6-P-deglycase FrlB with duplicated sugar isomerase (SIS) domain [Pedococcus dokdonensis]|uniref:Fructoselysine-6-P-deglycase FrlB with duplicated sugar isomerase (SIS) domain n=1 Tax=Pedococcus dokdonensis TaxID=443156 RepID=A0A1H0LGD0_9MICO|nr:SIS domain-containing protein [Pedococcus dokdonensis]SDO67287.1 Fructoselysine-6-P-deglycase FrlB with duplicated sugar isomerase (SIS) domain [Pedococcus dokdonensis]
MTTSHLAAEIATQAADWRAVLTRVPEARAALPAPGARVAVTGCGTSYYMAQAYAALREGAGQGHTDAFAASEYPLERDYDHVVAISRSGTTTEVVELLEALRARGRVTTAIVATAGTPIPGLAKHQLMMDEVDEQSVVQTRFATTTLALLRATLGEDLTAAIADAEGILAEDEQTALAGLLDAEQLTFVGRGWTIGLAHEAALKLRESAQFWTESYPAMEYRHGPISIATTGRVTWAFGEVPDGLADDVRATGARFEHRDIDPLADLVRLHRLCVAKAQQAGVDPDRPRHLSRSIILT